MLTSLSIKNYALIDFLSIKFDKGFTAITGETGAGKSILLGALSLILGKRADTGVLSDKSSKCVIEGVFNISELPLESFFKHYDLDYDAVTFVRREILPTGKSRAFINDTPVKLNILKELGIYLVNIHSQHQTLMLSNSGFQLEVLDGYVDNNELLASYRDVYRQFDYLRDKLKLLKNRQEELKKEEDFLTFQFEELDAVEMDEELFKVMEERQQFLMHAEEVLSALGMAGAVLSEDEHNLLDRLVFIKETLGEITGFYPKAGEILERLESVWLELKDIADEIAGLTAEGEVNPAELSELTEKRDRIYRLMQKYRATSVTELITLKAEISDKLLGISGVEEDIEKVSRLLISTEEQLKKLSLTLSAGRKKGAGGFSEAVQKVLRKLGMKDAVFEIRLTPLEHFTPSGADRVDFWFSANKGVAVGEISKIASGGELSRVMLAIKSLVYQKSFLPTIVFDEIDAGVSGDIAGKVGGIMQEMGQNHQLIVITHLPQIASKATHHYKVFKQSNTKITRTQIALLSNDERVAEIATMLSGHSVSEVAREAAKELLN